MKHDKDRDDDACAMRVTACLDVPAAREQTDSRAQIA